MSLSVLFSCKRNGGNELAHGERWFSLSILAVVLVFFIRSFQYNMFSPITGLGEAFVPRIVAILLLFFVLFYVWNVFQNKSESDSTDDREDIRLKKKAKIKQGLFLFMLIASFLLIEILGMIVSLGLFLIFSLRFIEKHSWFMSILVSVVTMVLLYLIFVKWVNVVLPSGMFF